MKAFCAAMFLVLIAGPALAAPQTPRPEPGVPAKSQREIDADKAAEQAYQKSLGNIADKAPADPWGNVRSDSSSKPVAKSTHPKPKTTAKVQAPEQ